jgi:hypothetical protein
MALHAFMFLPVVCLLLSLARLGRLCWFALRPSSSRGRAKRTTLHRLLKPRLSPLLHQPVCYRTCAFPCASLVRGQKPPGRAQADQHRRLCLSQSAVRVLRHHRFSHSRFGRRRQAWACRAHPDVSLPGLPHHLHFPAQHPLVPSENPLAPDRHGALGTGRRARPIRRRAGLRLSTRHEHEPFCSVLVSTHRPCTSISAAISGSLICSWTNYAPGCATPHRCSGSG